MRSIFREFMSALWEVFKLPFSLVLEGFRRFFNLGWQKIAMLIIAAIILTVVTLSAFFEVTSHPDFCSSCHLMRPYIEAWKTSSHGDIDCMECHARAGISGYFETKFTAVSMLANYVTGLYKRSKPWAEIEDSNCLQKGCHDTRLLDGTIEFTGGITFDHTPHLTESRRGRRLRCTSCHSQIVQGEHISVTSSTCYLCHFKNVAESSRERLAECDGCHSHPPQSRDTTDIGKFDHSLVIKQKIGCEHCHQSMWQGSGEVRPERCGACHSKTAHIDRIDDLEFVHEWHIEKRKVECQQCHDPIEHKQLEIAASGATNCSACHADLHQSVIYVYKGEGSRLIDTPMPNKMYLNGVACQSCHRNDPNGFGVAKVDNDACTPCHPTSYINLTRTWREGFSNRIKKIERAMNTAGGHPRIEDARHDVALIKRGGAWHNPLFTNAVLNQVSSVISMATKTRKEIPELPITSQPCIACHTGISDIIISSDRSSFNHISHLLTRAISCTQCHRDVDPSQYGHGRQLPAKPSCSNCHHGAEAQRQKLCAPCHEPSRRLYVGNLPAWDATPSPMADAGMTCIDCHTEENRYRSPENSFCLDCHDQEAVDDMEFQHGEIINALERKGKKRDKNVELVALDRGSAVHHPTLAKEVLKKE